MDKESAVIIPSVGESVSDGTIASWLVSDGQGVKEGDMLLELETDKATLEVPALANGVITIEIPAGSDVSVGQRVATITPGATQNTVVPSETAKETKAPSATEAKAPNAPNATNATEVLPLSPAVRRIVAEHNIAVEKIVGTGKGGRITKDDVLSSLRQDAPAADASPVPSVADAPPPSVADAPPPSVADTSLAPSVSPAASAQHSVPLSRIRQRIAENLVQSKSQAAHLTTFNEIDMTEVIQLRSMYKEEFEHTHGVRIGFMSFFVKASCLAIRNFPIVNAFLEERAVVHNHQCHIGVALASDKGLIVPVIRTAEDKGFAQIEAEIKEFARAAQEKRLSPDSLRGGTFTITNGGVFGSLFSTPIPNPPQTAILGMHAINQRPAVVGGAVVPRPLMYVALTYDHRLVDGKEAIGFLKSVKDSIEQPARLMLGL